MTTLMSNSHQCLHRSNTATPNSSTPEVQIAVAELYVKHRAGAYKVAMKFTRNADDAQDVVQNVFLRMLRNDRLPDVGRSPGAYVKRAAANAAIDLIRKRIQMAETLLPPGRQAAAETFVEDRHVVQVLETLSPENAKLFDLHYRGGFQDRELAQSFGLKLGTVKSRLNRIRAALQKELAAA